MEHVMMENLSPLQCRYGLLDWTWLFVDVALWAGKSVYVVGWLRCCAG